MCPVVKIHSEVISIDGDGCLSSLPSCFIVAHCFLVLCLFSPFPYSAFILPILSSWPPTNRTLFCSTTMCLIFAFAHALCFIVGLLLLQILVMITFYFTYLPICTNPPPHPPSSYRNSLITSHSTIADLLTRSSPNPWEGGDGRPQQQDSEDHGLWPGSRVAPHHQDERRWHLRVDGSRSHPLVYVLQG